MLADHCSHGIKWTCQCRECDLIAAREIVSRWGDAVDQALRVINEHHRKRMKELKKTGFKI